jgi:hypothetical protein
MLHYYVHTNCVRSHHLMDLLFILHFSLMILLFRYPSFKLFKGKSLKLLKTSYLTLLFSCIFKFTFSPVMCFLFDDDDDVHDLYLYLLVTAKVNSIPFCMNYSSTVYIAYDIFFIIWCFKWYTTLIIHFFLQTVSLGQGVIFFLTHFGSWEDTV